MKTMIFEASSSLESRKNIQIAHTRFSKFHPKVYIAGECVIYRGADSGGARYFLPPLKFGWGGSPYIVPPQKFWKENILFFFKYYK